MDKKDFGALEKNFLESWKGLEKYWKTVFPNEMLGITLQFGGGGEVMLPGAANIETGTRSKQSVGLGTDFIINVAKMHHVHKAFDIWFLL